MTPIIAPPCFTLDECAFFTDALALQMLAKLEFMLLVQEITAARHFQLRAGHAPKADMADIQPKGGQCKGSV
jgi:hypothetical protein